MGRALARHAPRANVVDVRDFAWGWLYVLMCDLTSWWLAVVRAACVGVRRIVDGCRDAFDICRARSALPSIVYRYPGLKTRVEHAHTYTKESDKSRHALPWSTSDMLDGPIVDTG